MLIPRVFINRHSNQHHSSYESLNVCCSIFNKFLSRKALRSVILLINTLGLNPTIEKSKSQNNVRLSFLSFWFRGSFRKSPADDLFSHPLVSLRRPESSQLIIETFVGLTRPFPDRIPITVVFFGEGSHGFGGEPRQLIWVHATAK